ncbi:hypothetical protein [Nocardia wallacei]|uniref:hypothetical protein n=1 Tax=Nocardia wallacei TaxID=480035 RepID=UPI002457D5CA|nr:hypothetical protein [Nocardia wallacei]
MTAASTAQSREALILLLDSLGIGVDELVTAVRGEVHPEWWTGGLQIQAAVVRSERS